MPQLGRLKKTTNQKHSCGTALQLRTRGVKEMGGGRVKDMDYLYCPRCDEEIALRNEARRRREVKEDF